MIFNMVGKGGGGSLLISDTLDASGGTIRTITATKTVKLQTKTITPTSSIQTVNPDTGYDGFSQVTVNAGESDDFVITLYYELYTEVEVDGYYPHYWVPDKTYDEIGAAYQAGKNVTVVADIQSYADVELINYDYIPAGCKIETNYGVFLYSVVLRHTNDYSKCSKINYELYYTGEIYISSTDEYNSYILDPDPVVVTPTTSQQIITPDFGYDGMTQVTVNAIPTMTLPTSAAASATSGYTSKATIGRSTAAQYINIPPGYNSSGAYYTISATPNGSATGPTSLSGSSATVSTGTNTLTLTKTGVTTTPTVSAGYVSSATASTATVTLTASVTTKAAATITPTTTNQTIAAGTYLTGAQTIAGDADLVASNIISTANIFGVQGSVVLQTVYTGSSAPSSSTGANGDIYIQS